MNRPATRVGHGMSRLAGSSNRLRLHCLLVAALALSSQAASAGSAGAVQTARLDPVATGERFGAEVAISGDTVAVGASFGDTVFTFGRHAGGPDAWGLIGTVGIDYRGAEFGSRLDLHGDVLAVGAPGDEESGPNVGTVFVYHRDESEPEGWRFVTKLRSDGPPVGHYADGVAVFGDRIVVAADGPGPMPVDVYRRDAGGSDSWGLEAQLLPGDVDSPAYFGGPLAMDGGLVAVRTHLFGYDDLSGHWSYLATAAPETSPGSGFGSDVFLRDETLLVSDNDIAFAFQRDQGGADAWGEVGTFTSLDSLGLRRNAVAYASGYALGGNSFAPGVQVDAGAAYLFAPNRSGGGRILWRQVDRIEAADGVPGARFSEAMDVDGTTLIIGAPGDNTVTTNTGAAYLFELTLPAGGCDLVAELPADFDGVPLGSSVTQALSVTNVGTLACALTSLSTSGNPDFYLNVVDPLPPVTLNASESVAYELVFEPQAAGARTGTVHVASSDPGEPSVALPLAGEGLDPGCALAVTRAGTSFDNVPVGATVSRDIRLSSIGFESCTVAALDLVGDAEFSLTAPDLPIDIARGDPDVTLSLGYAPTGLAANTVTLTLTSNDRTEPVMSFHYQGSGTVACNLRFEPLLLDFGLVPLGTSPRQGIDVTLDTHPLAATPCTIVDVSSLDDPPFAVYSAPVGATLFGGDDATVLVEFTPPEVGAFSGIVTLSTDDPMRPSVAYPVSGSAQFDGDQDGTADAVDNCLTLWNPAQIDADGDGFGNRCDQDLDNNCIVNAQDLGIFKSLFFGTSPIGDFNGDGIVGTIDLGIFRSAYFAQPGPSALATCGG